MTMSEPSPNTPAEARDAAVAAFRAEATPGMEQLLDLLRRAVAAGRCDRAVAREVEERVKALIGWAEGLVELEAIGSAVLAGLAVAHHEGQVSPAAAARALGASGN
jgi:hypothetical protein